MSSRKPIPPKQFEKILETLPSWEESLDQFYAGVKFRFIIPERTILTLQNYLYKGVPTGDFLKAVLANDLHAAITRSDSQNRLALPAIVSFIHWVIPVAALNHDRWTQAHQEARNQPSAEE